MTVGFSFTLRYTHVRYTFEGASIDGDNVGLVSAIYCSY